MGIASGINLTAGNPVWTLAAASAVADPLLVLPGFANEMNAGAPGLPEAADKPQVSDDE
jgi:hypothetical protein